MWPPVRPFLPRAFFLGTISAEYDADFITRNPMVTDLSTEVKTCEHEVRWASLCGTPCSVVTPCGCGDVLSQALTPVVDFLQINTDRTIYKPVGMRHTEGGWPENVDGAEADQVDRYLKKANKVCVV